MRHWQSSPRAQPPRSSGTTMQKSSSTRSAKVVLCLFKAQARQRSRSRVQFSSKWRGAVNPRAAEQRRAVRLGLVRSSLLQSLRRTMDANRINVRALLPGPHQLSPRQRQQRLGLSRLSVPCCVTPRRPRRPAWAATLHGPLPSCLHAAAPAILSCMEPDAEFPCQPAMTTTCNRFVLGPSCGNLPSRSLASLAPLSRSTLDDNEARLVFRVLTCLDSAFRTCLTLAAHAAVQARRHTLSPLASTLLPLHPLADLRALAVPALHSPCPLGETRN